MITRSASLDLKAAADSWNIRRTLSGSSSVAGCQPETVDTIRARSSSSRRSGSRPEIQSQSSDDSLESDSDRSTESFGAIFKKSNFFFSNFYDLTIFIFYFDRNSRKLLIQSLNEQPEEFLRQSTIFVLSHWLVVVLSLKPIAQVVIIRIRYG